MKLRTLLLPLMLYVAAFSSNAANSSGLYGDLGRADIGNRNDLKVKRSFAANCFGPMDKSEGPECSVTFSSAKMKVDNSFGIVPDQIVGISTTLYSPTRKYVSILYKTSNANTSIAQFSFRYNNVAKQFLNSLVLFMSGELNENTKP